MRKLIFVFALIAGVAFGSYAQEVGVRFGGVNGGGGAAVDGIFSLGKFSRVHADVGFFDSAVGIDALWDFLYKPLQVEKSTFHWYAGVGPSMTIGDVFWLGVSGELGIEYRFAGVPIAIGADWRPTFWIIDDTRFGADSFGLNVRWVFGSKSSN
ncbi:hypothetical protein [Carboxylicivirga marina]|uniref:Outer membrane insertion C-signal n=1 Tax=Carboxylicivirga marina TaxID=2800988 RepID=A0ABS1HJL2_9BACT|nr:hypothetical protein [Carboxylicivirga marina]MBK3517771.1 hypothetical protein [Carboxylicivirga marina]